MSLAVVRDLREARAPAGPDEVLGRARDAVGPAVEAAKAVLEKVKEARPASRTKGITRQTPQMTGSHPGMAAVRLRMTLRIVIATLQSLAVSAGEYQPAAPTSGFPSHRGHLSFRRRSHPTGKAARGAPHTRPGPPPARKAREAAEAAAGPHGNPRTDDRRSWGR